MGGNVCCERAREEMKPSSRQNDLDTSYGAHNLHIYRP